MKVELLILFLFFSPFSFSQNQELLQGKVFNQNLPIKGVDVINYTTKAQTTSDQFGDFSIAAKTNDLLIFITKNYELKRLVVNQKLYSNNSFTVVLNLKPEELKEVVITKIPSIKLSADKGYEQGKLDDIDVEKRGKKLRTGVYDGTIENGAYLLRIGEMILGLFIKEKEAPVPKAPKIEFTVLAKSICKEQFYLEKLKLKPDQIDLFLQFCNEDPKAKIITSENNELSMMDFLTVKNIEFKKF